MRDLIIRTDASSEIGIGHIMRCLVLAWKWKTHGGQAIFLSQCENDTVRNLIRSGGHRLILLTDSHPHSSDITQTISIVKRSDDPWMVIDGYHFDSTYQQRLRSAGIKMMVIDDMGHLPHYYADILLNQNINAPMLPYKSEPETLMLLGSRFTLLRSEFANWRGWCREFKGVGKKILVTVGGGDPENVTLKIVHALSDVPINDLEVKLVVGPNNDYYGEFDSVFRNSNVKFQIVRNTFNLAPLMAWADIAVAAGGSTCWELAFMRLPSIILVLAENQKRIAEHLHKIDAFVNLGWHNEVPISNITGEIMKICNDVRRREEMSNNCAELIDGFGVDRILDVMNGLDEPSLSAGRFNIRPAILDDVDQMWRLANEQTVRLNSFNSQPIPLGDHQSWYYRKLCSPESRIWVLDISGIIVAQVRYDRTGPNAAEVDFSVVLGFRGRDIGTKLLSLTCQTACDALGINIIRGIVFKANIASIKAFTKAGFVQTKEAQVQGRLCYVFELCRS